MDHGTNNPEPSWPQSAYTRAYAAAEPGESPSLVPHSPNLFSRGSRLHSQVGTAKNHTPAQSVPTSFTDEQLGDLTNLDRPRNKHVSHVNDGYYEAYGSLATPGNESYENLWATAYPNKHSFAPLVSLTNSPLTEDTFAASADYSNDIALSTAPISYTWGSTVATTCSNNNTFAPFVKSNLSPLIGSTFAAGFAADAAYNDGPALPTAPFPYAWGGVAPAIHSNSNTFASLVDSNPSPLTGSTFTANITYSEGITHTTAPVPYTSGPTVASRPMNHYMSADFHYPDPALPIMDPFAADTNGNGYHGQFSAANFSTQLGAAITAPTASHATHNNDTVPFDLAQRTPPPRPTCATCNRSFRRKADLDRHAKKHQADAKTFRCGCGYSSYRKDKLDEHGRRSGHLAAAARMSANGV